VQKTESFTGIDVSTRRTGRSRKAWGASSIAAASTSAGDKAVIQARRLLLEAVKAVRDGKTPRGVDGTYYALRAAEGVLPRDADWREVLTPEMSATRIEQTV